MNLKFKFFTELPDEARFIRTEVFIKEQGFKGEFDDVDGRALHLVIYDADDNTAVGTARLFQDMAADDAYTIGRLAVLKEYRKHHLGSRMISLLEDKARELGAVKLMLSAQCRVQDFYAELGYTASGEVYYDEYCPHIHMEKCL